LANWSAALRAVRQSPHHRANALYILAGQLALVAVMALSWPFGRSVGKAGAAHGFTSNILAGKAYPGKMVEAKSDRPAMAFPAKSRGAPRNATRYPHGPLSNVGD